jgi:hypothetical protein
LISFVLIIVTSFLFKNHVSPKHFVYLLPAIAILNIELFNNVTTNPRVRQGLFFVAIIYLAFKSLVLIDIFRKPVDIESSAIASKAIELSASRLPIISCGNCFYYYIKNYRYKCMGGELNPDYLKNLKEIIYIETYWAKDRCDIQKSGKAIENQSVHYFYGGTVRKILFY